VFTERITGGTLPRLTSSDINRDILPGVTVNGGTKLVGVFGYPVEHSLSPAMHNAAFAALHLPYIYLPFCVAPPDLGDAIGSLKSLGIIGVNLTIPHKEAALQYLDEITPEAREVGAVNTVHCIKPEPGPGSDCRLVGDNTDGYGFYAPIAESGRSVMGRRVVILGAGGAARSVAFRLAREGARLTIVNRSRDRALRLAEAIGKAGYPTVDVIDQGSSADQSALYCAISDCEILVQTTRVGMHPESIQMPSVPLDALTEKHLVYDLVYNPVETTLLREARSRGCSTITGVRMLVHQGAAAFHRWTGEWPPVDVMERAVLDSLA
jgi:shikimate dehydrogenase